MMGVCREYIMHVGIPWMVMGYVGRVGCNMHIVIPNLMRSYLLFAVNFNLKVMQRRAGWDVCVAETVRQHSKIKKRTMTT